MADFPVNKEELDRLRSRVKNLKEKLSDKEKERMEAINRNNLTENKLYQMAEANRVLLKENEGLNEHIAELQKEVDRIHSRFEVLDL
jgi:predicted nuclease with TOPRIM domain